MRAANPAVTAALDSTITRAAAIGRRTPSTVGDDRERILTDLRALEPARSTSARRSAIIVLCLRAC